MTTKLKLSGSMKTITIKKKKFFVKDKTGRGYTAKLHLSDLLTWEDDENWDGDTLHEWVLNAEEGDTWENATTEIICTQS